MKVRADWLQDPTVQRLFDGFAAAGYQLYAVGGCVRNAVLGVPITDIDLCTDAPPKDTMRIVTTLGHTAHPTGLDHGTVTAVCTGAATGAAFEITTFRKDIATDGRRAVVAFAGSMEQDAQRRDFTMNALYVDRAGQVFDPTGDGLRDTHARRVRFIGDAGARIQEDTLRILRLFRFYAWYGADLDADGLAACTNHQEGLDPLSRERVGGEVLKLLAANNPAPAVAAMAQTGILARVLPGADAAALPILVHLEGGAHPPNPLRRLAVLTAKDQKAALRLSTAQAKAHHAIAAMARQNAAPHVHGYRLGREGGLSSWLVHSALLERPVMQADLDQICAAAGQVFPLKAADVMPTLAGRALGQALRRAEADWLASQFTMGRAEMIAKALGDTQ